MASSPFIYTVAAAITLLIPRLLCAGTLDDAPFRVVVPGDEWQIEDSEAKHLGRDVYLAATITKSNTPLRSVVLKAVLKKTSASPLDEFCAGIRDSLANPAVKKISESNTTFVGHMAKKFVYEVTQDGQITYNQATLFVADGIGWTIACVGRADQKNEIDKMISIYHKKAK